MHIPLSIHGSKRVRSAGAILLLIPALLLSVVSIQAEGRRARGPDAQTSSDGVLAAAVESGARYEAASRGSGRPEGRALTVRDEGRYPALASPGSEEGSTESVIGADGRVRITNTTASPYRMIVHITGVFGSSGYGCTGWLYGKDIVATAGHCVYSNTANRWATNVRVYPGRNGSSAPYSYCTAKRLHSVSGWTSSENRNYDYGAIKLNCSIGNTTGWFGYRWTSASLTGQASYISGYPGDKPYATQWRHNDQIRISQTYRLYYANDTAGGQSGAPVWNGTSTCNPCGIGIHAYGVDGTGYNGGTRIREAVFNNMKSWKDAP